MYARSQVLSLFCIQSTKGLTRLSGGIQTEHQQPHLLISKQFPCAPRQGWLAGAASDAEDVPNALERLAPIAKDCVEGKERQVKGVQEREAEEAM